MNAPSQSLERWSHCDVDYIKKERGKFSKFLRSEVQQYHYSINTCIDTDAAYTWQYNYYYLAYNYINNHIKVYFLNEIVNFVFLLVKEIKSESIFLVLVLLLLLK